MGGGGAQCGLARVTPSTLWIAPGPSASAPCSPSVAFARRLLVLAGEVWGASPACLWGGAGRKDITFPRNQATEFFDMSAQRSTARGLSIASLNAPLPLLLVCFLHLIPLAGSIMSLGVRHVPALCERAPLPLVSSATRPLSPPPRAAFTNDLSSVSKMPSRSQSPSRVLSACY